MYDCPHREVFLNELLEFRDPLMVMIAFFIKPWNHQPTEDYTKNVMGTAFFKLLNISFTIST